MTSRHAAPTSSHLDPLREEFRRFIEDWSDPGLYFKLDPLDAIFAYRLFLGRNPNPEQELPHLVELSKATTLREFLASLTSSPEFASRTGFMPPNHLLMAELPDFRFWFDTRDTEMGVKMGFGIYEPDTVGFFRETVTPGMTCWDIGAQTGFYTCLFAVLTGETGRVCAYEPMPRSFEIITRNVRENRFGPRVAARNVACSNSRGHVPMLAAANMYVVDRTSASATSIECVRLDEEDLPLPGLIKIDVEGHEPAVLQGLSGVFARCNPILVLELNEYWLKRNSAAGGAAVLRYLDENGFDAFRMEAPSTSIRWKEFQQGELGNCNVVARRRTG